MIDDLVEIARIPLEQIEVIAKQLESVSGFLGRKRLFRLVEESVGSKKAASSTVTALNNLQARRIGQIIDALDEWREVDPKNREKLSDITFADLKNKLLRLIREYPVLVSSQKARRLHSVLGNELQGIELICDVRPVYNKDRDVIGR